jgi:hypothetical protein
MFCCFVNWCQTKLFWLAWLRMLLLYRIGNNYAPALCWSWDQTPCVGRQGTSLLQCCSWEQMISHGLARRCIINPLALLTYVSLGTIRLSTFLILYVGAPLGTLGSHPLCSLGVPCRGAIGSLPLLVPKSRIVTQLVPLDSLAPNSLWCPLALAEVSQGPCVFVCYLIYV